MVSTTLWIASASSEALPEMKAPTNLATAIPRLAIIAMMMTFVDPPPLMRSQAFRNRKSGPVA